MKKNEVDITPKLLYLTIFSVLENIFFYHGIFLISVYITGFYMSQ